jgi:uncharacterized protein with GYD domain
MATYIVLLRFTQQGIQNIKQSPARLDAYKQALSALGGEMKAFYMTMGRYDLVAVIEAPDDETAAKTALGVGSKGNVTSETLRAFPEADYRKIIAALP